MNLARIELLALFTALAKRVRRFTILEQEPLLNNVLRRHYASPSNVGKVLDGGAQATLISAGRNRL